MPRKYVKTGQTPEGKARRLRAHFHNSLQGFAAMMERQCLTILNSDTTTYEAKDTAAGILALCGDLKEQLKIRVD